MVETAAQNDRICTTQLEIVNGPAPAHNGGYRAAPAGRSTTLCDQCQVQMSRRVGIAGGHDAFLTA
jgi:hypothetical protein